MITFIPTAPDGRVLCKIASSKRNPYSLKDLKDVVNLNNLVTHQNVKHAIIDYGIIIQCSVAIQM